MVTNDHDFRSDAEGIALPYGIYDLSANHGYLFIGTSHDTPAFAVGNLVRWWNYHGRRRYPGATELLVLADGGGSNGARTRAWKHTLQERLCDRHGLTVNVCHYPPGASKWNPLSTGSSARSARTGPASLSTATRRSSTTPAPPAPRPVYTSAHTS